MQNEWEQLLEGGTSDEISVFSRNSKDIVPKHIPQHTPKNKVKRIKCYIRFRLIKCP